MDVHKLALVSPRFYVELRDVDDFVDQFGFHRWRFVADIPYSAQESWSLSFQGWLENLLPVEASVVKRYLANGWILQALSQVRLKVDFVGSTWSENAAQLRSDAFDVCVGDGVDPGDKPGWPRALAQLRGTSRLHFDYFAIPKVFVELVSPLVVAAPITIIVDPYALLVTESDFEVLSSLLTRLSGTRCFQLHVITRDWFKTKARNKEGRLHELSSCGVLNFDGWCEKIIERFRPTLPSGRNLFVHFVDDSRKSKDLLEIHERYVLNRLGAIELSKGVTMTGREQKFTCVDRVSASEKFHCFEDQVVRFDERLPRKAGQKRPFAVRALKVSA